METLAEDEEEEGEDEKEEKKRKKEKEKRREEISLLGLMGWPLSCLISKLPWSQATN